jgi:hypothetical protein
MKFKIYTEVFARYLLILIGYIFMAPIFLFSVLGWIGDWLQSSLFSFVASTKQAISAYDQLLNKSK